MYFSNVVKFQPVASGGSVIEPCCGAQSARCARTKATASFSSWDASRSSRILLSSGLSAIAAPRATTHCCTAARAWTRYGCVVAQGIDLTGNSGQQSLDFLNLLILAGVVQLDREDIGRRRVVHFKFVFVDEEKSARQKYECQGRDCKNIHRRSRVPNRRPIVSSTRHRLS